MEWERETQKSGVAQRKLDLRPNPTPLGTGNTLILGSQKYH